MILTIHFLQNKSWSNCHRRKCQIILICLSVIALIWRLPLSPESTWWLANIQWRSAADPGRPEVLEPKRCRKLGLEVSLGTLQVIRLFFRCWFVKYHHLSQIFHASKDRDIDQHRSWSLCFFSSAHPLFMLFNISLEVNVQDSYEVLTIS